MSETEGTSPPAYTAVEAAQLHRLSYLMSPESQAPITDFDDSDIEYDDDGLASDIFNIEPMADLLRRRFNVPDLPGGLPGDGPSQGSRTHPYLDSDFLTFIYTAFTEGLISNDQRRSTSHRSNVPEQITASWLRQNPDFDKQGIRWLPEKSESSSRRTSGAMRSASRTSAVEYGPDIDAIRKYRLKLFSMPLVVASPPTEAQTFFQFKRTMTSPSPYFTHFQLRNLVCPVSKSCIYYAEFSPWPRTSLQTSAGVENDDDDDDSTDTSRSVWEPTLSAGSVMKRINPDTGEINTVISRRDIISSFSQGASISTLAADSNFSVMGGFCGQYLIKTSKTGALSSGYITSDITTHISIVPPEVSANPPSIVFSSNDGYLRTLDIGRNKFINEFHTEIPVNCSAYNPQNSSMRLFVGDSDSSAILDTKSGKIIGKLNGHLDHGFACAWSSDGYTIATGNQDGTVRVYDTRNSKTPLRSILSSRMNDAIRSMCFDESGQYLAFAEPVDYVSVIETGDFQKQQYLDHFGEIVGIGFTSDGNGIGSTLTVGVTDPGIGCIVQYERPWESNLLTDYVV